MLIVCTNLTKQVLQTLCNHVTRGGVRGRGTHYLIRLFTSSGGRMDGRLFSRRLYFYFKK